MGVFEQFPYANMHEMNLEWLLKKMKELDKAVETFIATESLKFADPIIWNIATQYEKSTIVIDPTGNAYLSLQPVPTGVQLNNDEYWLEIFNFTDYTRTANQNLTVNVETNTTRATAAYAVDDWLIWNDVLYKVTSAIAIDDTLIVAPAAGSNIIHFTVEDFIKAFMTWATNTIQQYKNDIDASELAYQSTMQAEVNRILAGATVDSEVIDARYGADGVNYPTLGAAIRTQFYDLTRNVNSYESLKKPQKQNLFDSSKALTGKAINENTGNIYTANNYTSSDFMPIIGGFLYKANKVIQCGAYYDSNKTYISGFGIGDFNKIVPKTAAFIRITVHTTNASGLSFCYGVFDPDEVANHVYPPVSMPIALHQVNLLNSDRMFSNMALDSQGNYSFASNYAATERIPVTGGASYKCSVRLNQFAQYASDDSLISISSISPGTVTVNNNCAYVIIAIPSSNVSSAMFCLESEYPLRYVSGAYKQITEDSLTNKPWYKKVLCTIGDSLTNTRTWQQTVLNVCGFDSYTTAGAIGATIAKVSDNSILQAIQNMDTSAHYDLITFWGGTNDWGAHTPMGDFDTEIIRDNPSETNFYGACICCIRFLLSYFPSARIVVITPTPRSGYLDAQGNNTVKVYGNALKKVATYYGLPVLDLMEVSGINEFTFNKYMYLQGESPNQYYLHFTEEGGIKIGRMIGAFINNQ